MVIMTEKELIERLQSLVNQVTFYKNKYPYNLGLVAPSKAQKTFVDCTKRTRENLNPYSVTAKSFDCSNLVKALCNGYDVNSSNIGYFQSSLSNTGDCTEVKLLNQCSDISSDFSKLGNQARLLYTSSPNGHIGVYLGKVIDDKYNVIECTCAKAIGNGVCYSWIDADGTRRNKKNGTAICKWQKSGLMTKWVEYPKEEAKEELKPEPIPTPEPTIVYYVKKGDTLSKIAKEHNMSLAKLVSYNPQIKDINKINVGDKIYLTSRTVEEYYTVQKGDTLGAIARKFNMSLNKLLGLNPDIKNPNLIHVGDKIRIK